MSKIIFAITFFVSIIVSGCSSLDMGIHIFDPEYRMIEYKNGKFIRYENNAKYKEREENEEDREESEKERNYDYCY